MSEIARTAGEAGSVGGPGLVHTNGEEASIVFRRLLRHPIQDVWEALTEPDQVASWAMVRLTREDSVGGRLEMEHPNQSRITGRVLAWQPPRTYEYELHPPAEPGGSRREASIVRWDLTPTEEGTLLEVTHRRLTRGGVRVVSQGLRGYLDRFTSHMDGTRARGPA